MLTAPHGEQLVMYLPSGPIQLVTFRRVERMSTTVHDGSRSILPRLAEVCDMDFLQHRSEREAMRAVTNAILPTLLAMHAGEQWGSWDADGREVASC